MALLLGHAGEAIAEAAHAGRQALYRKKQRTALAEKRAGERQDARASYKGGGGGGDGDGGDKGVVGACTCTASCQRGCVCKKAKQQCTDACHPRNRKCTNHGALVVAAAGAAAGGAGPSQPSEYFDDAVVDPPDDDLDENLIGETIAYLWEIQEDDDDEPVLEWAKGKVVKYIGDEEDYCEETGELLNFVVEYPEDGEQTQALSIEDYDARRVAKVGSWYVVTNARRRARVDPDAPGGP